MTRFTSSGDGGMTGRLLWTSMVAEGWTGGGTCWDMVELKSMVGVWFGSSSRMELVSEVMEQQMVVSYVERIFSCREDR